MTKPKESYRIRCISGERSGMWLWTMGVAKGRLPIEIIDWGEVLQHPEGLTFHPHFAPEVVAALTAPSREIAEGCLRILTEQGFVCEIVRD